jgi:hypothetical protein
MRKRKALGQFIPIVKDYTANVAHFNGEDQHIKRTTAITGMVDGKLGTLCGRFKVDNPDGENFVILEGFDGSTYKFRLERLASNLCRITIKDELGSNRFRVSSLVACLRGWHTILISWNASTAHFYMNNADVYDTATDIAPTNKTYDYSVDNWLIASRFAGSNFLAGCIQNLGLHLSYIDLSVEANREKFYYADGTMKDPGVDGSNYFGSQPVLFFQGGGDGFNVNSGSGEDFTVQNGSLLTSCNSPAYNTYSQTLTIANDEHVQGVSRAIINGQLWTFMVGQKAGASYFIWGWKGFDVTGTPDIEYEEDFSDADFDVGTTGINHLSAPGLYDDGSYGQVWAIAKKGTNTSYHRYVKYQINSAGNALTLIGHTNLGEASDSPPYSAFSVSGADIYNNAMVYTMRTSPDNAVIWGLSVANILAGTDITSADETVNLSGAPFTANGQGVTRWTHGWFMGRTSGSGTGGVYEFDAEGRFVQQVYDTINVTTQGVQYYNGTLLIAEYDGPDVQYLISLTFNPKI